MEGGSFLQEFIAGNTGGLIGISVVYPLDTAKMRMQTHPQYKSAFDVIATMTKANGVGSLYRGLTSPALGFGLTFAASFSAYGYGCRAISQWKNVPRTELGYADLTMAGAFTGVVQTPVRQVVERIKGVMQVRERDGGKSPYKWSGACFIELIKKEGWRNGLFQGMSSVLLREVPQFAVYYPVYEFLREIFTANVSNPMVAQFLAGGTAGTIQWLPPIYCLDVIKSRMQTAPRGTYSGIKDCATQMYAEGGYKVFFRGLTPALLRAFPLHAIIFVSYEIVMGELKKPR